MTTFAKHANIIDAELEGRVRNYGWRKVPSQVTTAGIWFDISMSPGSPVPKYWFDAPPLIAKTISQSQDGGIYHGPGVFPYKKYTRKMTALSSSGTPLPMKMILCDYLLYYPTCDDSVPDPQYMDNTISLTRNVSGVGNQVIAVSTAARNGGASFTFSYTNDKGISGRTSPVIYQHNVAALGSLLHNARNTNVSNIPFLPLQNGDTGVRSIESVTMITQDVGLFTLIIVNPFATMLIKENTAVLEKDFLRHKIALERIEDDAFLSFICLPNGSLSGVVLMGDFKVIWDNN